MIFVFRVIFEVLVISDPSVIHLLANVPLTSKALPILKKINKYVQLSGEELELRYAWKKS